MTFVECFLEGTVHASDIDWWIEAWHAGLGGEDTELHDYLGLSWDEYSQWCKEPSALADILKSRSGGISA